MSSGGSYAVGLQYAVKKYCWGKTHSLYYQSHGWWCNCPTCPRRSRDADDNNN